MMIKAIGGGGGRGMRAVRRRRGSRRGLSTLRLGSRRRVRRRRRLCRAADRERAAYRGSDRRRRPATSSRSASATARCSAGSRRSSRSPRARAFPGARAGDLTRPRSPWRGLAIIAASARSSSWSRRRTGSCVRVHRGQSRACRSSTPSPRRPTGSTSCACRSRSPRGALWRNRARSRCAARAALHRDPMAHQPARPSAADVPSRFDLPSGPGVRVDTLRPRAAALSTRYDPLIAKLIVRSADATFADAAAPLAPRAGGMPHRGRRDQSRRCCARSRARPNFASQTVDTGYFERHIAELTRRRKTFRARQATRRPRLAAAEAPEGARRRRVADRRAHRRDLRRGRTRARRGRRAGRGRRGDEDGASRARRAAGPRAPRRRPGGRPCRGGRRRCCFSSSPAPASAAARRASAGSTPIASAPISQRALAALGRDAETRRGPAAMAKRHALGLRSARENIADLCDPGSFSEYGAFAVAAQRSRRSLEDLVANTPADGIITGIGARQRREFGTEERARGVLAYDATVLAGTQGLRGHEKTDRLIEVAEPQSAAAGVVRGRRRRAAGRHRRRDRRGPASDDLRPIRRASGQAPVVGIAAGPMLRRQRRAARLLRRHHRDPRLQHRHGRPGDDRGRRPRRVHARRRSAPATSRPPTASIDVLVEDEAEAVAAAKRYLSFFQGPLSSLGAADPRLLRARRARRTARASTTCAR